MGDRDHGAGVLGQVLLQPQHGLGVEMVGRFVEQEQVGLLEEQLAQCDPAPLAPGQGRDVGVRWWAPQGVHRLLQLGVEVPRVGVVDFLLEGAHLGEQGVEVGVRLGHLGADLVITVEFGLDLTRAFLDVAEHGLVLVEDRLLHEDAHGVAGRQPRLPVRGVVQARHDLEHRGLAGAVGTDNADLGSRQERQRHVVEDDLVAVRLAGARQHVDEFGHAARLGDSSPHPRIPFPRSRRSRAGAFGASGMPRPRRRSLAQAAERARSRISPVRWSTVTPPSDTTS